MLPWYKDGLRFTCTECGECCKGKDAYVFLSRKDVKNLCAYLQLSEKDFFEKYTQIFQGKLALIDNPHSNACIFLEDNACKVYSGRPTQCATFPWWPSNIKSKKNWKEAAKFCEGIGHSNASVVPNKKINEEAYRYLINSRDM